MAKKIQSVQQHEQQMSVKEVAAPATPPAGYVYIYAKADGKLYIKDDTGAETDLTATAAGGSGLTQAQVLALTSLRV